MTTETVVIPLGEPWVDSEGITRGTFERGPLGEAMRLDYDVLSDPERRRGALEAIFCQLGAAVVQGFTLDELHLSETGFTIFYSRGERR